MALVDFYNSLKASSKERINSPLYGAFILAWVGWNWEALYVTFFVDSQRTGYDKIYYIQGLLQNKNNAIWYPLLSTLLILMVLPFLRIFFFWVSEQFKLFRDKIAIRIEDKKWLSPEAAKVLKKQLRDQEDEYEESLSKKEEINLKLQNSIDKIENELSEVKTENLKLIGNNESILEKSQKLEVEIENSKKELVEKEKAIDDLNNQNEVLKNTGVRQQSRIDSLEKELEELNSAKSKNDDSLVSSKSESMAEDGSVSNFSAVRYRDEYYKIRDNTAFKNLMHLFKSNSNIDYNVRFDATRVQNLHDIVHLVNIRGIGKFLDLKNSQYGIQLNEKGMQFKKWYSEDFGSKQIIKE